MAALYDRYAGLFLHTNAAFLCERAHAEAPSSQTLEALASCYLRQGAATGPTRRCAARRSSRTGATCSRWPATASIKIQRPRRRCCRIEQLERPARENPRNYCDPKRAQYPTAPPAYMF